MSDLLPDDAWVNSFLATSPRPLLSALQRRLHASTTHVNALAELYKQRAAIEAAYAEGLSKLARTAEQGGLSGKTGNDWEKASGEGRLWDSIISELTETSASHSTLSAVLRTDFEQPLRELPSKVVAWRRIGEQDASLDKTLKEYEKTSAKLEKASSKAKSSKADVLQNELNQITSSLSSLSPMVYTTYQRLDEERLRVLKEVVVRWGTVKGDMATRDGQRAENIISTLLSWETSDEVLKVGRKLGGTGGARVPESAVTTPRPNRRLSTVTSSTNANTPTSDFSPRPTVTRANGSSSSNPQSTFAGGIKSMLGRTKIIGGGRTRSESNANSTRSGRDRDGNFEAIGEEATAARIQDSTTLAPPVDEEGFSVAPSDRHRNPWEDPNELVPTPAHNNNTFTRNFTASPNASQENLPSSGSSQNQTQPRLNLSLAPKPIQETEEERQAALQRVQQTLQMPPSQPSRRSTIARGRRDVRNTMFAGSTDDGSLGLGGLSLHKVAEPEEELVESPSSGIGSPVPVNGHSSASHQVARRTSSASVTSNNPFDSPGLTQGISLPVTVASSDPGLRANLNESINVILRGKEVQRIQITGEIHLSLRPGAGSPATTGPIHIRLNAFERLEKIAPNPAYLAQVPDRPGEYFLNSEVLAAATAKSPASGKGTLLFKYVVHVQPGKETSSAPLILDPAFLCKDGETRMILNYRLNETSPIQSLSNVTFIAAFAPGPAVNNVQAKPAGGVWSPSTRRMQWKLDALPAKEGKIIAKFITEPGEALSPQGVQTSWSVEGTLTSGLGLEVVSGEIEGNQWTFEEVQKNVTAGKYLAEPTISQ
nr:uncharacterized protein CI109_000770 [Kwoniella shandongensis]KAA5530592.1 hypothetical protein CI109_000770 [Kwoniella shandongensis]